MGDEETMELNEQEKIELKSHKIMTLLSVVSTIGDKFIQDKDLKDRVVNKATSLLENELEDY